MQATLKNLQVQAFHIFNGDYTNDDLLVLYSVLTDEERGILDYEYQRLRREGRNSQHITNSLVRASGVLIDISSRK